jgi:hypothetical protein
MRGPVEGCVAERQRMAQAAIALQGLAGLILQLKPPALTWNPSALRKHKLYWRKP